jgi:hypothetical protein
MVKKTVLPPYFFLRPRITSNIPETNATALPAEAGAISGTAAIA